MPKNPLTRIRAMSRAQRIAILVYGWLLIAGLIWYTTAAIHLGWKAVAIHALTYVGAARIADLILVPVVKRVTVRRINRTVREMRLLRDEHRTDPVATRKLTQVIDQMGLLADKAKTL